ncbi:MAG: hypothetical protein A2512_06485 [Deltaproteobacteria bacterium RIFOXYD12_FULL_56_24]|nr:MAG: hypothetical protein A2512_06485 [Deltaproteobacteria bacterium RIFOXYD12_FULL_56_24]
MFDGLLETQNSFFGNAGIVHFLCLPKENEPKERAPCHLSRRGRDTLCSSMLPGLCKLGCASNIANPFSAASPVLGCVTMGF